MHSRSWGGVVTGRLRGAFIERISLESAVRELTPEWGPGVSTKCFPAKAPPSPGINSAFIKFSWGALRIAIWGRCSRRLLWAGTDVSSCHGPESARRFSRRVRRAPKARGHAGLALRPSRRWGGPSPTQERRSEGGDEPGLYRIPPEGAEGLGGLPSSVPDPRSAA